MSDDVKGFVFCFAVIAMGIFTLICLIHMVNMNCDVKDYVMHQPEYREFLAKKRKDEQHAQIEKRERE